MTSVFFVGSEPTVCAAVSENVSMSGMLFRSNAPVRVGDVLKMNIESLESGISVTGQVVRVGRKKPGGETLFNHIAAVRFETPLAPSKLPAGPWL